MESERLSKPSYALSYEKDMINHIIKTMFTYSCEFEITKKQKYETKSEIIKQD